MSAKRQSAACSSQRICLWNCLIGRFVIALYRAVMPVSTACCLWLSSRQAFIAGRFARHARRTFRTAGFLVRRQRRRKRVPSLSALPAGDCSGYGLVARNFEYGLAGARSDHRWSARWRRRKCEKNWQNALAWVNANCGDCFSSTLVLRPSRWRKRGGFSLPTARFTRRACPMTEVASGSRIREHTAIQ